MRQDIPSQQPSEKDKGKKKLSDLSSQEIRNGLEEKEEIALPVLNNPRYLFSM